MKVIFWKNFRELFGLLLFNSIMFAGIIMLIIFTILYHSLWPGLVSVLIMFIVSISILFFQKRFLSKVTFSNEGIEWTWLKKKILFINWSEISDIKEKPFSRVASYLSFIVGNQCIDVDLNKKMYNTIMIICPDYNIKKTINNIYCFKYLHREDDKL